MKVLSAFASRSSSLIVSTLLVSLLLGAAIWTKRVHASGVTYYVASNGSDNNNGSSTQPFRQIRKALSVVSAGDTILVSDGDYLGFDLYGKNGTSTSPITIKATGQNVNILKTTDRSDNRDTIHISFSSYVVLDGVKASNANRAAIRINQSHHITVRNGSFTNNTTWGIFTNHSDDLLIENNVCSGSINEHGIYVSNSGDRPVLRRNRTFNNRGAGIQLNADLSAGGDGIITGALIEKNIIYGNGSGGGAGLNLDGVQDSIVRNNLLYNNLATGIALFQGDGAAGPRGMQVLHNTIDMASTARWALLIWNSSGLNTVRNNILFNRNTSRGGITYLNQTDVSNTNSDFNILDKVTPNDSSTVLTLAQWQAQGHEIHSLSVPLANLFVDPATQDYHLKSASPAIDKALTLNTVTDDMDNSVRPAGSASDIGCYEYAGQTPTPTPTPVLTPTPTPVPTPTPTPIVTPTPTPTPVTTITLRPTADAYVRDGSYASTNYGTAQSLITKRGSTGYNRWSYLKYDLVSLNGLPIATAKLRLYGRLSNTQTSSVTTAVYSSSNTSWTESTINWKNRPASASTALKTATIAGTTAKWYEWDVTSFIKTEKSAGRNLITLVLKNSTNSNPTTNFNSKESTSNQPQLLITTSTSIPTPTPTPTPVVTPTPTPTPTPVITPTPTPTPTPGPVPDLGPGASLRGKQLFPSDNPWNQDISNEPVDPNSANLIASIGLSTSIHPDFGTVYNGAPNGIPYVVVSGSQPKVPINFTAYGDESDPGPYPVPANAPIEGGPNSTGDRHVLVIDRDNWMLYEMFSSYPVNGGASWNADCGAVFDLKSNALRPAGWTSADAAGLPIFPGLVRYDEVFEQKEIRHALRFTASITRRAYVYPARHFASSNTDPNRPPMGMRVRLKANVDISGYSPNMQVILRALKKYGMFLADNGGNWFISGAPDPRWNDSELRTLKNLKGSDFEVVKMGTIVDR
jgi:hypothetical protein